MMDTQNSNDEPPSEGRIFATVMGGTVIMGFVAIGLGYLFGVPIGPQLSLNINDILIGVIATLPPALFLWWFSRTDIPTFVKFRREQIEFFASNGFEFTMPRVILMAIGAGVSEELLFRGVFQSWIAGFAPVLLALIISNVVFGLLHMRTMLYAIIAGCIGFYLGILYIYTENLLAPIITHGLYDFIALAYTKKAIEDYRRDGSLENL